LVRICVQLVQHQNWGKIYQPNSDISTEVLNFVLTSNKDWVLIMQNNSNLPKIFAPGINHAISTTSSRGHHVTENFSASNSARRTTTGDEGADVSKIINNSNSIVRTLNDAE
ncbi:unnamed protein product, partial [Allacma fusca]